MHLQALHNSFRYGFFTFLRSHSATIPLTNTLTHTHTQIFGKWHKTTEDWSRQPRAKGTQTLHTRSACQQRLDRPKIASLPKAGFPDAKHTDTHLAAKSGRSHTTHPGRGREFCFSGTVTQHDAAFRRPSAMPPSWFVGSFSLRFCFPFSFFFLFVWFPPFCLFFF